MRKNGTITIMMMKVMILMMRIIRGIEMIHFFPSRSHASKSSGHRRTGSKECSSLPRHGDLHLGNDSFLNGNKPVSSSLSPTLHAKNYNTHTLPSTLSPTLHQKNYVTQTLNRSTSYSKDLANHNLPHLLSPRDTKVGLEEMY